MEKFQSNGTRIYSKILGEGEPIIFLHGFLEDHTVWDTIYPSFLDLGFKIILIDLPCHGRSRFLGEACSMQQMSTVLANFLKEKNIVNPFIFGHSMGGYVGLELLRLQSAKLTLIHSNFWTDSETKKRDRNRVIEVVKTNKNLFLREAIPNLFAQENKEKCLPFISNLIEKAKIIPSSEIIATTKGLRDRRASFDIMNLFEVNIIQGTLDNVVPKAQMLEQLINIEKKVAIKMIEDVSHMSHFEDSKSLINHLKAIVIE